MHSDENVILLNLFEWKQLNHIGFLIDSIILFAGHNLFFMRNE